MNLKIANYFGIPLYLNIFIFPFIFLIYISAKDGLGILTVAIYTLSLFFVFLHEYGHCFIARRYGWNVKDISILPIGGVARIYFKHHNPKEEIVVAIAGPIVNFILFCMFTPLFIMAIYLENFNLCFFFLICALINLMILVFNLFVCVFPMDGGRVFRACLSLRFGYVKATWWAVRIGQILGTLLAGVAFYYGFIVSGLILILVSFLSQNELAHANLIDLLHKVRADVCQDLDKPELKFADLPELIAALEVVDNEALKSKLSLDCLLPLLKDLQQSQISI